MLAEICSWFVAGFDTGDLGLEGKYRIKLQLFDESFVAPTRYLLHTHCQTAEVVQKSPGSSSDFENVLGLTLPDRHNFAARRRAVRFF
jgi:hypothetical protein